MISKTAINHNKHLIRTSDVVVAYKYHYEPNVKANIQQGKFKQAHEIIKEYLVGIPSYVYSTSKRNQMKEPDVDNLVGIVLQLHQMCGNLAQRANLPQEYLEQQNLIQRLQ